MKINLDMHDGYSLGELCVKRTNLFHGHIQSLCLVDCLGVYKWHLQGPNSGFNLEECSHHAVMCCSAVVLAVVFMNMENYIEEGSE